MPSVRQHHVVPRLRTAIPAHDRYAALCAPHASQIIGEKAFAAIAKGQANQRGCTLRLHACETLTEEPLPPSGFGWCNRAAHHRHTGGGLLIQQACVGREGARDGTDTLA